MAVSGQMVGVSNGTLIVVGGSMFAKSLFEGGRKEWVDTVFVLEPGKEHWQEAYRLDQPLAYGAAVSVAGGMICLGGGNAQRNTAEVFRLRWTGGRIEKTPLPRLPHPCAMMAAAMLGERIYVAGGQESPQSTQASRSFWTLDLSKSDLRWEVLKEWPGAGRILPAAAAQDGAFYLFSGAELEPGDDGKAVRRYLNDAYRFRPGSGWDRLVDLPQAAVAAPSIEYGQSHILLMGGDNGANAFRIWELKENHPGFSREILAFHTITGTWSPMGTLPVGLVTSQIVRWGNSLVIPGGEDRPGRRSAAVLSAEPLEAKGHFGWLNYTILATYLLANLLIGVYFGYRQKSTEDFFRGGQRIAWWAAGIAIFGTQLSSLTFMAVPAKAYATDWTYILVNFTILLMAPVVVYCYLPFFRSLNVTTAYEYLERRFNLGIRLFASTAFVLLQTGRMAIILFLPSMALAVVSDLNVYVCILAMGLLCTLYTLLGGIEAVTWTDVLQVIVLLGAALLTLVLIASRLNGGAAEMISVALADGRLKVFHWSWDYTISAVWVILIGNLFAQLIPYTTDQAVIQRYLTTPDQKQAARAIWVNGFLSIPASLLFFSIGTALYVFYRQHPQLLNPAYPTDAIFPWFIVSQMPSGLSGLVIAGVFAAAQSTVSGSQNSVATVIVTDFFRRLRPQVSDLVCLRLARWMTVVFGIFATSVSILMVTFNIRSLWDVFLNLLGLVGGTVAGLFALGIFTVRANGRGAAVGAAAGVMILYLAQRFTSVHFFLYAAVGMCSCFIVGYAASRLLPEGPRDLTGLTLYTRAGDGVHPIETGEVGIARRSI